MNLIIDIGNTATKCALFDNEQIISKFKFNNFNTNDLQEILERHPFIKKSILCSVVNHNNAINEILASKTQLIIFDSQTKIPIKNLYKTPETLGKDRLAAAIGANSIFPNKNVLSIDIGTCIKYDFVDEENNYLGGAISPGITMRYKALNQFTGKLPLINTNTNGVELIGKDTKSAIQSGVQNGAALEIIGAINEYRTNYKQCEFIITGGGANQLQIDMKIDIFAVPNLVLIGLNKTLINN